ncbi:hypothetical protein SODALDRAFT_374820 [Sodiomyces alkalinus F11]|uniref:Uncharacterized protein n=1 Tax=Sodiomyces alkalinus (strain CBS 110278 / VKM F-3762 / F11) TaxID=1314773 RepID=A0A3N2Q6U9_SODAK|nr:hypothetical protein SODALDRAFT_374820 [Sodiomyces alkalinus F11]ROT42494.1 hypothetical protein SODALDRAFT_374820 [Sodiomyces alkalinus F11]
MKPIPPRLKESSDPPSPQGGHSWRPHRPLLGRFRWQSDSTRRLMGIFAHPIPSPNIRQTFQYLLPSRDRPTFVPNSLITALCRGIETWSEKR